MTVICPLCVQTCFSSLDALHHRLIKASNGPLACPICNEILMGLDKLTIHLFCHSASRSNEILPDKTVTANAGNFNCEPATLAIGETPFPTSTNLNTTNSVEWNANLNARSNNGQVCMFELPHKCTSCSKMFASKDFLLQHMKEEHVQLAQGSENIGEVFTKLMETDFPIQNFSSEECTEAQNNYVNSSADFVQDNPNLVNNDSYAMFKASEPDGSPKVWRCNTCSKSFTTKYFLKKHKRLHTGEMPYTCGICARTFTFQQSYHKHLMYHSDEKPHTCTTCGRAFKELSTLHNHERIHSGEKPYKCEVCGKCFRQRVSFLVHSRIHTGVMPYKCEICNKSFRYKVTQRTHKCQLRQADGMGVDETEGIAKSTDSNTEKLYAASNGEGVETQVTDFTLMTNNNIMNMETTTKNTNEALQTPPINEMLLSSKDTYLPLLDIQNIHLFSPNDNDSVQSSFSNIFG